MKVMTIMDIMVDIWYVVMGIILQMLLMFTQPQNLLLQVIVFMMQIFLY